MKKIDEDRQRKFSYLLNDLKNFNEIFRNDVTYHKIKSHKYAEVSRSLWEIHFWPNPHQFSSFKNLLFRNLIFNFWYDHDGRSLFIKGAWCACINSHFSGAFVFKTVRRFLKLLETIVLFNIINMIWWLTSCSVKVLLLCMCVCVCMCECVYTLLM